MEIYKSTVLAFFTLLVINVSAQKNFFKEAERKFDSGEYFAAIDLYKAAYKKAPKNLKPECLWKTAECYRIINEVKQAELYYQKAIKAKAEQATLAQLYLADMLKMQEKYPEAIAEYEKYKKEVPSDKRGIDGVKACELAQKWKDTPTRYVVGNMVQINAKEWDYAPTFAERKKYTTLLFVSTRKGATGDIDANVGQTFADIFATRIDKNGKWSTPVPLPPPVNTKYNEGPCVLDEKGSTMYFTRCSPIKNKKTKCQLFETKKRGQNWEEPALLPFQIDTFTYGHPALSKDGTILVFASDLEDSVSRGFGGLDLYYSLFDKKTKKWGTPVNLGPDINTDGDEVYPFLRDDGTLYYSSSGLIGMGGLDIFKAETTGPHKWTKPENMQYPINSAGDDFGICFEGERERGYLTSNRAGGKGGDDIYSFILPPLLFMLEGYVTEELTKLPIPGATIKLVGSDNTSFEIKTDEKGHYKFETNGQARYVNEHTSYVVSASALDIKTEEYPDGCLGNPKARISTVGEKASKSFRQDFELKKIVKNMRMPVVLFELNKADLTQQGKDSLEYLVGVLKESPNITVELSAHTDYRSDAEYNQKLSYARAKTCVDYLVTQKGIEPDRISPAGYGESQPAITQIAVTTPSGKVIPAGTTLSQKWIDSNFPSRKNKNDYEFIMQMNRRVAFSIKSKNYVPKAGAPGEQKVAPEIKMTKSLSEGGEGDTSTEWDDEPTTAPATTPTGTVTPTGQTVVPVNSTNTVTPAGSTAKPGTAPTNTVVPTGTSVKPVSTPSTLPANNQKKTK